MKFKPLFYLAMAAGLIGCYSCVRVDTPLGENLIPTDECFTIYNETAPLEVIDMKMADSLSGYSQTRITIGALRDSDLGLTTRGCAVTLLPFYDSLDMGENPVFKSLHLSLAIDTISIEDESQRHILQNVNVYELSSPLDSAYDINGTIAHGSKRITKGTPVYNGVADSLVFDFNNEFGQSLVDRIKGKTTWTGLDDYLKAFPGIYIDTDTPVGEGGRINMFDLQLGFNGTSYVINGNYATLSIRSYYNGASTPTDTSFYFYLGANDFYDADSLLYYGTQGELPQYCLNVSDCESRKLAGPAGEKIYVEGAGGLKPVIPASEIRRILKEKISPYGDPATTVVNKVSLILPFEFPDDYTDMDFYPEVLSPTCKIKVSESKYSYAGLTDSSSDEEDQGDVNRSLLIYSPDITYHAQSLLKLDDDEDLTDYDIWFLIMHSETVEDNTSASEEEENSYYNSLMYASYYNNMYGGYGSSYGYGSGYGSYGSSSYSNYYSYYLMSQMYGSSDSSTETTDELDIYRFYKGVLRGPSYPDETLRPQIKITFSIPKEAK